ncbi:MULTISPECIES: PAS domain S-box protein [unclassified Lentimicrobium]|uniref:PAS domain S-box protein n=1 Tax=unclassified Lentimicrobium TaxID=2677434 RepID=UPI00155417CD|nr:MULTISPECIES: PAS domain S-box protein [unclassified Lentimicrobium]NPD45027.1 PAS domain S-box protein [Lentimicrobium sp. S6]NPD86049.1 PAS domain S-box protein [Lentimicrobium sp. L6]
MKPITNQAKINQHLQEGLRVISEQLHGHSVYIVSFLQDKPTILKSHFQHDTNHHFDNLMFELMQRMIEEDKDSQLFSDLDKYSIIPTHPLYSSYIQRIPNTTDPIFFGLFSVDTMILDATQKIILSLSIENFTLLLQQQESISHLSKRRSHHPLFELIFQSVSEAISIHDLNTERFIAVNNKFEKYAGLQESEIINKTVEDLGFWYHKEEHSEYTKLLQSQGYVNEFSAHFTNSKGKVYTAIISAKVFNYNDTDYILVIIGDTSSLTQTQRALQSSEKKFRTIFNALPDPTSINKLDETYAFTDINDAFIKNLGASYSDYIGKSGFELNLWADKDQRQTYIETIKKQGYIENYQAKYRHPNGNIIEGLVSAKTIEVDNVPHLLVLQKNLDHFIKLKKSIKISEEKFRMIFNASPDAINIIKADNYNFVDVNQSFQTITQYKKEELIGKSLLDFNFWTNDKDAEFYIQQLKQKGEIFNLETTIQVKDGQLIQTLLSAAIIEFNEVPHIINISKNIEDIANMKRDIIESENKFRSIVENSHAAIVIIDNNEVFNYANPKSEEIFGDTAEELIGQKFEKWIHPSSINLVKERYSKRQKGIKVPYNYEFKLLQSNGTIKDIEISSSIHKDKAGRIFTIAQLLDITKRKEAIDKAFNEQQKLQQYLNIAPHILIALDINGNVEMVNERACEILGYKEKEIIGKNWFENFLPTEIIIKTKQEFKQILNGAQLISSSENDIITNDKKIRRVHWQSSPIIDQLGVIKGLLSSGEDITDRMNTLKILNQTKVVAILWKYQKDKHVHPIEYVSPNISKLIGYTPEELIENQVEYPDLIHPDDLPRVLNEVNYYVNNSAFKNYSHEYYRLKSKNGDYAWVEDQTEIIRNIQGEITHLNGLLIDVSEKKKSIELIKESEERYRTIFNSNLDGLIILNEQGDIVEVNEVTCNMYGYTYQELMHRDSNKIKIASDINIYFVKDFLETNKILIAESEDIRKDGSPFNINAKLRYITYNHEKHILVIIRDITDIKRAEKQLIDAKQKAEESDQLKSSFLANMSHEIRTPMNAIIGFSSLLEEDDIDQNEKSGFISRIKNNGQNLLNLINDIIDISKIEANQIRFISETINIKKFLSNLYDSFEIEAKKKSIHLIFNYSEDKEMNSLKSDTYRLNQVMVNFLSNALKFTPKNGVIEFGCKHVPQKKHVMFYVKDSGIGIPKAEQEFVFDRFRQAHTMTHTDYGGTGLGLSISKGLIEHLKGDIWMKSEEGKGSEFYFSLPY